MVGGGVGGGVRKLPGKEDGKGGRSVERFREGIEHPGCRSLRELEHV